MASTGKMLLVRTPVLEPLEPFENLRNCGRTSEKPPIGNPIQTLPPELMASWRSPERPWENHFFEEFGVLVPLRIFSLQNEGPKYIANTILGVPSYGYSIMGPKTLL